MTYLPPSLLEFIGNNFNIVLVGTVLLFCIGIALNYKRERYRVVDEV